MSSEFTEKNIRDVDPRVLLVDLLRGAKRLLWLGVLLAVMVAAVSVWHEHRSYTPVYRATASFTVTVTNPLYAEIRSYNAGMAEQMAETFPHILSSGVLNEKVMNELGMTYLPTISATAMKNTNIFELAVTSGDAQLAYDVLNAVIKCYPDVAEFVVGPTAMTLLSESGVPGQPINGRDYLGAAKEGAVLGVALWLVLVVLFALTRTTIHNEKELEKNINLRCIGILPMAKGYRKGPMGVSCPVITKENDKVGFSEAVRLLRIRVEKEMRENDRKILMVSSATPSEGKTTVAANLAIALAHKGKRTLLVDCDLRNPSVAEIFGKENTFGLSTFLNKQTEAKRIIFPLETKNFFAVFGGPAVANAAELLARKEMAEFLETARGIFDYIILDTPPSAMLADAAELTHLADCALMTVRQNRASRGQILEGVHLLSDSGLPLIGCVLNGVEHGVLKSPSSYYGYGYGKYYSGYGGNSSYEQ